VESDGRHTEVGGKDPKSESNVIRLPCDWLGPREELVPIGRIPEPREEPPLAAADFWGDGSAAMHAPIVGEADTAVDPRVGSGSRSVRLAGQGLASGRAAWAWAVRVGGARWPWVVIGVIAAVACLGVALASLGSGSSPRPARRMVQSAGTGRTVVDARRSVKAGASRAVRRRSSTPAHGVARHRHRIRSHETAPSSTAGRVVAAYRPTGSSDGSGTATSSTPALSQATHAYASQSTAAPSRASAAPPAFGAQGALGPGSSSTG
jgi:hypothetical protein